MEKRYFVYCKYWLGTEYWDFDTEIEAEEAIERAVRCGGIREKFEITEEVS